MRKILVADPELRIDIRGIMQHRFFAEVNWQQVEAKQVSPPYVPPPDKFLQNLSHAAVLAETASEEGKEHTNSCHSKRAEDALEDTLLGSKKSGGKHEAASKFSTKSSPSTVKRSLPNKILGDFHLTKINKVFQDF